MSLEYFYVYFFLFPTWFLGVSVPSPVFVLATGIVEWTHYHTNDERGRLSS